MIISYKCYKTELNPTVAQAEIINRTLGVCRYVYNFYLAVNIERHKNDEKFITGMDFSKWLNNEYLPLNPEKSWIKEVSSKSVKKSIMDAENAYKRFFKGLAQFPHFKRKGGNNAKMYFVKNGAKAVIRCERHRIKIPTLGWVRLKEYGYIPVNNTIKSGTVSVRAGRYYVSVLVEIPEVEPQEPKSGGIGIDLGIKEFATISDETTYKNINNTNEVRRLEKKLRREHRKLSRKYESLKKRNEITKGETTQQNIRKQQLKVQKIYYRLDCIRTDYLNKTIAETVKTKPEYIAIEDLNIAGMMKNRYLSKAVANQKFYEFRTKLMAKCHENGTELRIVDRWYPSSKTCHACGTVNKNLTLNDRVFKCECGYKADRDLNAALNLRDTDCYIIAKL